MDEPDSQVSFAIRRPRVTDAAAMWQLVRDCGVLDVNSCYAYLLICRDFAETSLVASSADTCYGFVSAYTPPSRPDVLFVWQIGIAPAARRQGLAKRLLHAAVSQARDRGVRYLEATITASNKASQGLFRSVAEELGAEFQVLPGFRSEDFGAAQKEAEDLIRIGPF